MSEMLANRYFLAGRYGDAARHYESLLRRDPGHLAVRRKLLVCWIVEGRLPEALELATGIAHGASGCLDSSGEGLPCRELAERHARLEDRIPPADFHAGLGLLLLFCDEKKAVSELQWALELNPMMAEVRGLLDVLRRKQEGRHAST